MERNNMGERDRQRQSERQSDRGSEREGGRETHKKGEIWKERKRTEGRRGGEKCYRRPTA